MREIYGLIHRTVLDGGRSGRRHSGGNCPGRGGRRRILGFMVVIMLDMDASGEGHQHGCCEKGCDESFHGV